SFGGESGLRKLGLCGTHPLTRRYMLSSFKQIKGLKNDSKSRLSWRI
ncbi:TPA: DUF3265 domain-containing protein, partial [Vibrio vulnificus]|nr:DUF3265 domain-containing protein [Vibrio vulnificus]